MTKSLDPFDPAALRLPQDFTETASFKKLLETIPVGRFNKQDFFRTHPDEEYRFSILSGSSNSRMSASPTSYRRPCLPISPMSSTPAACSPP